MASIGLSRPARRAGYVPKITPIATAAAAATTTVLGDIVNAICSAPTHFLIPTSVPALMTAPSNTPAVLPKHETATASVRNCH